MRCSAVSLRFACSKDRSTSTMKASMTGSETVGGISSFIVILAEAGLSQATRAPRSAMPHAFETAFRKSTETMRVAQPPASGLRLTLMRAGRNDMIWPPAWALCLRGPRRIYDGSFIKTILSCQEKMSCDAH